MKRLHLEGEIDSPDGRAPSAAWKTVEEAVRRPEDTWLQGDPFTLLSHPLSWHERIRARVENPLGAYGLRLRFVFTNLPSENLELEQMVSEVLAALPESSNYLFIHAEIMDGPEPGVYLAYENRPPALVTQLHLDGDSITGRAIAVDQERPLHLNILLHNKTLGFQRALNDGILPLALLALKNTLGAPIGKGRIHELSIARSDSRTAGISVGLETVHQEKGAQGGFSAD